MNEEIKNYFSSLNFNEICRTCLSESEELTSLFAEIVSSEYEEYISFVYEIFTNISSMKVIVDDGLPTLICRNCIEHASNAFKFKIQCERSESLLQAYKTSQKDNKKEGDLILKQEIYDDVIIEYLEDEARNNNVTNERQEIDQNTNLQCNDQELNEEEQLPVGTELTVQPSETIEISVETSKSEKESANSSIQLSAENIRLRERIALKRLRSSFNRPRRRQSFYSYTLDENGDKVYACSYCEKKYKHATSLTVHVRSHTHDRPYLCTICGKGFKQLTSLSYHMRTHSGEQPYACNLCEKRYRQSASLTAHMRIHTGQRPFLCSVCGKGFRQAPDLSYHMRTHTKEKPYMCNVCGKRMSMQCHLVLHMRTHTGEKPFSCKDCGKAFASSTRLKRHEFIHTGLKPFVCEVCKKAFNRASTLRVHEMIHTDERPHQCQVCGKGFIQAHCLKSHLKTHF